jgi:hypothetical protein
MQDIDFTKVKLAGDAAEHFDNAYRLCGRYQAAMRRVSGEEEGGKPWQSKESST